MSDDIKITVRLDPGMHERLTQAAERERRSLNSQMVTYIERGLAQDDRKVKRAATLRAQS